MLLRTDPFQVLDQLTRQWFGSGSSWSAAVPVDAYRSGDEFVVHFDLPGVRPESIDVNVERNVLTVTAQRDKIDEAVEAVATERWTGTVSRQLFLGDTLDTDNINAGYDAGVLTLRLPVAERAKPRKIAITSGTGGRRAINA